MSTDTVESELIREQRGHVMVLRLNRPEARNALSPTLLTLLGNAFLDAEADPDVRAIVLTATGDRAFCAGMDLKNFASGGSTGAQADPKAMEGFFKFNQGELGVPVIGAANATALAGGFELLLACDLVVACEDAKFGLPEVKRGLFPAGGGVYISQRIPLAIALELCLTGDPIDAHTAAGLGLVNRVVPAAQVVDAAVELAEKIAANGPLAVKVTKQLVRTAALKSMQEARDLHTQLQPVVFGSEDAKEGATAFVEKRTPNWKGR